MDAQWSESLLVNCETEGATETQGQPWKQRQKVLSQLWKREEEDGKFPYYK